MNLYRLKLRPRSAWRTPWQADTLTGSLCAVCARIHGPDLLRDRLIQPMLDGAPPFVLSDACPGDWLPAPLIIRAAASAGGQWKAIKRIRWVTPDVFDGLRRGQRLSAEQISQGSCADDRLFLESSRQHNTLSRLTDATGEADSGLGPFARPELQLRRSIGDSECFLTIYFRAIDRVALELFMDLMECLSETGFGADIGTGRGQFDIAGDPRPVPELDEPPPRANSLICLSTFQPGPSDSPDGTWDAFPKFGKFGPDPGLANVDVAKRTMLVLRPGACFRSSAARPFIGRAVPMEELVVPDVAVRLRERGMHVVHPAFGLALPATLDWPEDVIQ